MDEPIRISFDRAEINLIMRDISYAENRESNPFVELFRIGAVQDRNARRLALRICIAEKLGYGTLTDLYGFESVYAEHESWVQHRRSANLPPAPNEDDEH